MKYKTHSQAIKEKSKLFIDLARVDSYYKVTLEMRNKMLEIEKSKNKKCDSMNKMQDVTFPSPRRPHCSHYLVCSKNLLFIVGIG